MARPFSNTDANRIIKSHQTLIKRLDAVEDMLKAYRTGIEKASDAFVAQEVLKLLRDIPIEEID